MSIGKPKKMLNYNLSSLWLLKLQGLNKRPAKQLSDFIFIYAHTKMIETPHLNLIEYTNLPFFQENPHFKAFFLIYLYGKKGCPALLDERVATLQV